MKQNRRSVEFTLNSSAFSDDYELGKLLSDGNDIRIAILGGGGIASSDKYYQDACDFAYRAAMLGVSIVTGGGCGVMEAGNKGASRASAKSYGVRVKVLPTEHIENNYINNLYEFNTLSIRLLSIISSCDCAVFFPGGFGTLEELFAILVRMRVGMMNKIPVFLYSNAYWATLLLWMKNQLVKNNVIQYKDLQLFEIVDNVDDLIEKISNISY